MTPTLRQTTLPGRVRLAWTEHGKRTGTPVVALHGVTDSCVSFEPLLPHLPDALNLVALSQRGHGESDKPVGGYRPADFAADLAAFLDALDIDRAVIVGHSMGSAVALRFALDQPRRVRGLVLIGAAASARGTPRAREYWDGVLAQLGDPVPRDFVRALSERELVKPVPPEVVAAMTDDAAKLPLRVWRAVLEARHVPVAVLAALLVHGVEADVAPRGDLLVEAAHHPAALLFHLGVEGAVELGRARLHPLLAQPAVDLGRHLVHAQLHDRDVGRGGLQEGSQAQPRHRDRTLAAVQAWTADVLREAVRMNREGDRRTATHFLERQLRWLEPYTRGIPGTETLLAELVLVQRRIGEEWDERTRKEVYAASIKRARYEEDLRAAPRASITERFSRPRGR